MNKPNLIKTPSFTTDPLATGAAVRAYREHLGLTMLDVAHELGHSYNVSCYQSEMGLRGWTDKKLNEYLTAMEKAYAKKISRTTNKPPGK